MSSSRRPVPWRPPTYREKRACSTIPASTCPGYGRQRSPTPLALPAGRSTLSPKLASSKSSTMSTALLRDRPLVQARVAEAEAILSAARAYVQTAVGDLWERTAQGESDLDVAVVQARLAIARGMHEAVRSVDLLFHAAGTNAVYRAQSARAPLPQHSRRRPTCRRPAGSHGGRWQGPSRPAPRRCGVVTGGAKSRTSRSSVKRE